MKRNEYITRPLLTSLVVCAAVLLSACATTQQTRSAKASGFLGDYSQLRKGSSQEAQLIYINRSVDFSSYDKILIEPITVWTEADESLAAVPDEDVRMLADHLHVALQSQLEMEYKIVERAGPGVMRLRAAITEAKGADVTMDVISTAIPRVRLLATQIKLATDTHKFVGKASVEGEIVDSLTGERLLAAVDQRAGTKVMKGSLGTWNDVKDAYDHWAERLSDRLRILRGD